jgi:hypothetical protein
MAAGDKYIDCTNGKKNLTLDQLIRSMIYDDGAGNPVLHTDPAGTLLQNFFTCNSSRKELSTDQVLRDMILQDADGEPYLNTTTS